jgi:HEAT repeat protein
MGRIGPTLLALGTGALLAARPAPLPAESCDQPKERVARLACQLGADDAAVALAAAVELAKLGPRAAPAIDQLVAALRGLGDPLTLKAGDALARIGPPALPALSRCARGGDRHQRLRCLEIIYQLGPRAAAAIPLLTELLRDPHPIVRHRAIQALGNVGPKALPALKKALADKRFFTRAAAARGLSAFGRKALPALGQALGDRQSAVRLAVVEALATIGAAARGLLRRAGQDPDPAVRRAAARALARLPRRR